MRFSLRVLRKNLYNLRAQLEDFEIDAENREREVRGDVGKVTQVHAGAAFGRALLSDRIRDIEKAIEEIEGCTGI